MNRRDGVSLPDCVRQEEKRGRNQEIRGCEAGTGSLPTGCLLNNHKEEISSASIEYTERHKDAAEDVTTPTNTS